MSQDILIALGGLGLFLLGMAVMTEGLKAMAGDALHGWLTRFTHSPSSGALTGTVATAVLQSSSATTVTTVGFVAAGLLTFPQALGIIFGANLGTTVTGWMVALFGFKLKIGAAALPVIFAGAMLRTFGRGRWRDAGRCLAGFGVIFLGISFMQEGMSGFQGVVTPATFPPDTLGGRIALVGIGALVTMVTQSSSAGVAIAMTALSVGTVSFSQAAALVIGMDVGTTVTAVMASIGSSQAARRTGFSHMAFNVFTALGALLLLGPYVWLLDIAVPGAVLGSPELALVGFHTLFNLAALAIGLPLANPFARLMEWLVPDRGGSLAYRLDERLLREPAAAAVALDATLRDAFGYLLGWAGRRLGSGAPAPGLAPGVVRQDLRDTRDFLDALNARGEKGRYQPSIGAAMHALDHLQRLYARLQQGERSEALLADPDHRASVASFRQLCAQMESELADGLQAATHRQLHEFVLELDRESETARDRAIEHAVAHDLSVAETGRRMGGLRWLQRVSHHAWRAAAHLGGFEARESSEPLTGPA
ncbi:MAG: Na/Pi cotransporter family protein [Xanthomonadales bacterium]|nr:Na/Pi cotransporter family protein [Xanthomonadales bacterium]